MKHLNARSSFFAASLLVAMGSQAQTTNVGVNANGQSPNANAILDVDVTSLPAGAKKGMLIPRMTQAERATIAPLVDGLVIYQTTAPRGFYSYEATSAQWLYMYATAKPWNVTGNYGTVPATNFLGTTDAQPLVFRTTNVERMRLSATGNVGVAQTNPVEKLDIAGAILFTGTSATNNAGTIRWNSTVPTNMYHEGNMDGTATGWSRLENIYQEVTGAAYTQPSPITCVAGSAYLGPWTTYYTPGPPAPTTTALDIKQVSPYSQGEARVRHQYMFRRNELNLELNQLFLNPNATSGLCPSQPITSVAFYVSAAYTQKPYSMVVSIKHTAFNALAAFDNTVDPAGVCTTTPAVVGNEPQPGTAAGWKTYTFTTPFLWDGVRNIVIDVTLATNTTVLAVPVWETSAFTVPYNCTYYAYGAAAQCAGTFPVAACGTAPSANCATGTFGAIGVRPVIQLNGTIASAAPAITGTGKYIYYNGGFLVEKTAGWTLQTLPYYAFKGPGTISAEMGVWDDQTKLNDHVFDRHFDGRVQPQDAANFGSEREYSIDEMANFVERNRHLPTIRGREEWEKIGGFPLGDLGNQLWVSAENQALYLTQLNDRMGALRALSTDGPLTPQEFEAVKVSVASMGDLTEGQKQTLLKSCETRVASNNAQR